MFEPLKDERFFAGAFVDLETNTLALPNELDLDAAVLHGDAGPAAGEPLTVIAEYHRAAS